MKFLPAQFSLIDVNVFKAVLYIQRFFNLAEYRELIVKTSLLVTYAGMKI